MCKPKQKEEILNNVPFVKVLDYLYTGEYTHVKIDGSFASFESFKGYMIGVSKMLDSNWAVMRYVDVDPDLEKMDKGFTKNVFGEWRKPMSIDLWVLVFFNYKENKEFTIAFKEEPQANCFDKEFYKREGYEFVTTRHLSQQYSIPWKDTPKEACSNCTNCTCSN